MTCILKRVKLYGCLFSDASNSWRIGQCSSYSISSRLVIQNLFRPNGGIKARLSSTAPQRSDKERSPSLQCNKESSGPQQSNQKSSAPQQSKEDICEPILPEKQTIFQKMKQLTKDYWHILIPVHVVTSIGWASMFYAAAKKSVIIKPGDSIVLEQKKNRERL